MLRRPRFRRHYAVSLVEPETLVLLADGEPIVIRGRLYAALAPLLDGSRELDQISEALAEGFTALDVEFGVGQLEREGYLAEGSGEGDADLLPWEAMGLVAAVARARLEATAVAIQPSGRDTAEKALRQALDSAGVRVAGEGELLLVLVGDYLDESLEEVNRRAASEGLAWAPLKFSGPMSWLGPVFRPPGTACWECLAQRLRQNRARQTAARIRALGAVQLQTACDRDEGDAAACHIAALEIAKWIVEPGLSALAGSVLTFDFRSARLERHPVARYSACPLCGQWERARVLPAAPELRPRPKLYTADGGHRAAPPEATYERLRHHVSPLTGVVEYLEPFDAGDGGLIHVWTAGNNYWLRHQLAVPFPWLFGRKSLGKGATAAEARVSALCEALERYCGVFRGDEFRITATAAELGEAAVHPNSCMVFSAAQYAGREEWNRREGDFNWVPEPFDENRRVEWVPVWSLTHRRHKYVPAAYCYYNYPIPAEHDFCRADSNGNAAGASLEDAVVQGLLELMERDSVALWWYNRLRRPAVELESFGSRFFDAVRACHARLGRQVWVLDVTADLCIPAMAAVSWKDGSGAPDFVLGFGAHFDPEIAVSRALSEMNQFLPVLLEGRRRRLASEEIAGQEYLFPDETQAARRASDYARLDGNDLLGDIEASVALLRGKEMEVLVLDQSRSDVELPVVKVLVPGLRPFWARFAPGRLYTVPVELGWLAEPKREQELNPAHLLI
jgi:ribosomal protein S12 methylthiotransferase accessory factor